MLQGASIALVFRVGGVGLAIALHLLLARALSVGDYGYYAAISAWLTFGLLLVTGGADTLIVRSASRLIADGRNDRLGALVGPHERRTFALACAIVAVGLAFAVCWRSLPSDARWMTAIMFAALPFLASTTLRQALLRAAARPAGALVPDYWVRPGAQIAIVALAAVFAVVTGTVAAAAYLAAAIAAWLIAALWTRGVLGARGAPAAEADATRASLAADTRFRDAAPFLVVAVATLALRQTDLVLVGALLDADAAGRYAIAMRVADLCSLVVVAGNVVLAPLFSELHHAARTTELRTLLRSARLAMLTIGAAIALVLALLAPDVLRLFGADYVASAPTLRILLVAQVIAIALGPDGLLLSMTGREVSLARVLAWSAVLNVALCAALVKTLGVAGAATATVVSTLAWRVLLALLALRAPGERLPT